MRNSIDMHLFEYEDNIMITIGHPFRYWWYKHKNDRLSWAINSYHYI